MLGMTPTADKTNGIIIILLRWYSCLISSPDICNIFLSMSLADCGLKGLLCHWTELLCNPSRVCSCNFLGWVAAHICNTQNMVSQEHECVLSIPDGKLWWPCHCYIIIIDHSILVIFTNDIPVEKHTLKKYSARQGNVKYQRANSYTSKCKLHVIKSLISYPLINWTVLNFKSKECKIYRYTGGMHCFLPLHLESNSNYWMPHFLHQHLELEEWTVELNYF